MGLVFRLVELLILALPLAGAAYGAVRAFRAVERRRTTNFDQPAERAAESTGQPSRGGQAAQWRAVTRVIGEHDRTDTRWLDYELDIAKLLDFPLMTDMRNPLTERFHKDKLRADLLRPARAEDLVDDRDAAQRYFAAVEDYVTSFDVAESEAIRRRRGDFTAPEQQRIARAQNLLRVAVDSGASPHEREQAYQLADKELAGLIVLPATTRTGIERGIAGELDG